MVVSARFCRLVRFSGMAGFHVVLTSTVTPSGLAGKGLANVRWRGRPCRQPVNAE